MGPREPPSFWKVQVCYRAPSYPLLIVWLDKLYALLTILHSREIESWLTLSVVVPGRIIVALNVH